MAYQFPEKLQRLTPYAPLSGEYRIRLDANESFLAPSAPVADEIWEALRRVEFNRYPDPYCVKLCEGFAAFYGVAPSQVVAGNGSDELIGLIVSWFTEPGDTMLTVSPDFSMYAFYAQSCGIKLSILEKPGLSLDADALIAQAKRERAKLVMFSNPCNPTSLCATWQEVERIVSSLPDVLVVADEAYMEFSEGSVIDLIERYPNLLVLKTCSKAFGMAAIRLGFAVGHARLIIALKAAKSPYNVNSMTQAVGCVLFSHPDELRGCVERIKTSRDQLCREIASLAEQKAELYEVINTCANFVFLRAQNPRRIFSELAKRGIAIRCMPPWLRISAGSKEENAALLAALQEIIN